jgi:hypothetical protein
MKNSYLQTNSKTEPEEMVKTKKDVNCLFIKDFSIVQKKSETLDLKMKKDDRMDITKRFSNSSIGDMSTSAPCGTMKKSHIHDSMKVQNEIKLDFFNTLSNSEKSILKKTRMKRLREKGFKKLSRSLERLDTCLKQKQKNKRKFIYKKKLNSKMIRFFNKNNINYRNKLIECESKIPTINEESKFEEVIVPQYFETENSNYFLRNNFKNLNLEMHNINSVNTNCPNFELSENVSSIEKKNHKITSKICDWSTGGLESFKLTKLSPKSNFDNNKTFFMKFKNFNHKSNKVSFGSIKKNYCLTSNYDLKNVDMDLEFPKLPKNHFKKIKEKRENIQKILTETFLSFSKM